MNLFHPTGRKAALFFLLAVFFVYLITGLMLDGSYGGGDGIRHFLVSKWSWYHPELFLYHWGKPFFTLITSPFSQFGLSGIKVFNAVSGVLTCLFSYLIARKLNYLQPYLVIIFSAFAPIYMMCINSGLTEPLFALILTFCIFLYLNTNYFSATLLLSFLPFVRSEGNMMFPLFAMILLLRGQWKYLPWMAFGTVVYSIVGYFHYKDIFWIKTKNPYTGSNFDIYGKGELLHFVKAYDLILGLPITILFCVGLLWAFYTVFSRFKDILSSKSLLAEEIILIYGAFAVYFVAHSVFWWKGLFGSLGLERAIAGVAPLAGLIGYRGVILISAPVNRIKYLKSGIIILITLIIAVYPFSKKYLPLHLEPEEQLVKEAGNWFNNSEYKDEKIFYLYPYFMHVIDRDPFNGSSVGELWGLYPAIEEWGIDGAVPLNTVILWDSHFGANEAYLPLEKLMADPYFKLIKSFRPASPFKTLGGYEFEIHAFLRVNPSEMKTDSEAFFDLESEGGLGNYFSVVEGSALSGKRMSLVNREVEFGVLFEKKISEIQNYKSIRRIDYSFSVRAEKNVQNVKAVLSVDFNNESKLWTGKDIVVTKVGAWETITVNFPVDLSIFDPESVVKIYIWNPEDSEFYVDDLRVQFMKY